MSRCLIFELLLVLPVTVRCTAQEAFVFQNYNASYGLDAPVFDALGNRLAGTSYVAVLLGGPTPDALALATSSGGVPMPPIPFTAMGGGQSGYFTTGSAVYVRDVCGLPAWLEVRAWDARLGSSYDEVVALGLGGYGQSALFQLHGSDVCLPNPPPPPALVGLQSFSLVPEPSTWALLALGGLAVAHALRCQGKPREMNLPK
jgi:hypothetical protein